MSEVYKVTSKYARYILEMSAMMKLKLCYLTSHQRCFLEKKKEQPLMKKEQPLMKKTHWQQLNMWVDLFCFGILQQPVTCEWRSEWIPPNISSFRMQMSCSQSRNWSLRDVGLYKRTMIQSILQNTPWSTSRNQNSSSWNALQSPNLNMIVDLWVNL